MQGILGPFHFLDLPIELRLAIYEIVLTAPVLIQPPVTGHHGPGEAGPSPIPYVELLPRPDFLINILLTCHQVCDEALPILYGGNTFQFQFPASCSDSSWSHYTNRFFKQIGPSNCALLRSAEIFFNFPYFPTSRTSYKFPTSIRSLTNLVRASVIVGTSESFTELRLCNGDKYYIKRTVQMLRRRLPENCVLEWDITGGHPQLEKALEEVYGVDGYRRVETETKRKMVLRMKARREAYPTVYFPEYCKGVV